MGMRFLPITQLFFVQFKKKDILKNRGAIATSTNKGG
jgi:hypothetical protein